ncbi:MAG: DUF4465 domain-containing protein [Gemmataceae bacterium]
MFRYALIVCLFSSPAAASVITLEDVNIPSSSYINNAPISSGGATFNNNYDSTFGSWGGFAASNIVDTTTPGYGNQYASIAGGGDGSPNYAVAYVDTFTPTIPRIDLPAGTMATSVRITNTTYAGLSMLYGDSILVPPGPGKKFGGPSLNDPDWFLLTITGKNGAATTGTVDFYLADYRFANNSLDYIVNTWTSVELNPLGNATAIEFTLTSTDNGSFGMNTPAYFALDNLTVTPVPEPCSLVMLGLALVLTSRKRQRRPSLVVADASGSLITSPAS